MPWGGQEGHGDPQQAGVIGSPGEGIAVRSRRREGALDLVRVRRLTRTPPEAVTEIDKTAWFACAWH
ncbi:hypothetical protein B6E66_02755 [Streptomyces maremycinicus]|nr:hypothetical protein B6E66_02755 [Streptomyces sp. B9173]